MKDSHEEKEGKPDLLGRPGIEKLVDVFYRKVRADEGLGHVFDGVAKVNWETHLPKICDFWDTVIFRAGTFRGNPLAVHGKMLAETKLPWALFERWLELFRETVDELFAGENAGHIVRSAEDMAGVIYSKIHGIPNPRHDPALLTPEQKARYASYREKAGN
ncbi:MAG: group III truncated hemoglobin [Luteolibacter sp.]